MSALLFLEILTFVANLISSQYYSVSKYSQFLKPREEILVAALLSSRAEISDRHFHLHISFVLNVGRRTYLHDVASVVFLTYLRRLTTLKLLVLKLIDDSDCQCCCSIQWHWLIRKPHLADFGHNDFQHCKVCVLANWRERLYSLVCIE